ncbi:unnamed protein product [Nippostrongylus brasiliensis]|uniref:Cytochrome P450 n=1 Tax=Nippostrongylus brasiliensis TaxID=27835 RepID=A0A0N4YBG0_NIPBR|nr:unnamed protein product [Nippostrongylus brasiliensis]
MQEVGESCFTFANRILATVHAAMARQDISYKMKRALEEFLTRLRREIRYHVKMDNPLTFEQAVTKAQTVEQILAWASADYVFNPGRPAATVLAQNSAGYFTSAGFPRKVSICDFSPSAPNLASPV